ncbi:hypothetical protein P7K49_025215, partial [Saguinus oedipus]
RSLLWVLRRLSRLGGACAGKRALEQIRSSVSLEGKESLIALLRYLEGPELGEEAKPPLVCPASAGMALDAARVASLAYFSFGPLTPFQSRLPSAPQRGKTRGHLLEK